MNPVRSSAESHPRYALVTGGGGGIGSALCRRLTAGGMRVLVVDRVEEDAVTPPTRAWSWIRADLAEETAARDIVSHLELAGVTELAALVHAAAICPESELDDLHQSSIDRLMRINLTAALTLTAALRPLLRSAGRAKVLFVGSAQATRAATRSSAYAASKGAIHALTRALAVDLAPEGILVNAISPGFIDTAMARTSDGGSEYETDWFQEVYVKHGRIPLRRPGTAEEVAAAAELLLADGLTYVTGAVLDVDGGLGAAL